MHAIHIQQTSFRGMVSRLGAVADLPQEFLDKQRRQASTHPAGIEAAISIGPEELSALVFVLPGLSAKQLLELATCKPTCYVEESADLRRRAPYIGWVARDIEVRVDCWGLRHFPSRASESSFVVVFASDDNAVIARNTLDFDEMDRLLADIQCSCARSGPNYRPWRENSDEAMALAEGRPETVNEKILTVEVWGSLYWWSARPTRGS